MERAERCFQRIFVGYASFYLLLLLLECAVQYVSGSARSFATHNALLNGLLLLMSLCAMFRLGQKERRPSLTLKLALIALFCVFGKEAILQGAVPPYAYAELLNGELFFMVFLLYQALFCRETEYF